MNNTGKRLGVAMLTVVVVLGLNAAAVLYGNADSTYARLSGYEPQPHLATMHRDEAAPAPVANQGECLQSRPKSAAPPALLPVTRDVAESLPVARMC